ncbi:MAG: RluA family pseudouridine synthase [Gemmataceae bacterium]
MAEQRFTVAPEQANQTLAALLRQWLPGQSWKLVRGLVDRGQVRIHGETWLDSARRLKSGDVVEVSSKAAKTPDLVDAIVLRHVDPHLVVAEKPAGISTVRHPAERDWLEERRLKVPTLDDLVLRQLGERLPQKRHEPRPRLRVVQRLDKETSGLIVFARSVDAERGLGSQFAQHTVVRRYLALVPGRAKAQTIRSHLIRDRGDGRRGSGPAEASGKGAVTHIEVVEELPKFTLLSCRLETGRTHQIRIHLSELGHPVCGEKVYDRTRSGKPMQDDSGCPRLFLHAAELGFTHPITKESMHWEMPLPPELRETLEKLR